MAKKVRRRVEENPQEATPVNVADAANFKPKEEEAATPSKQRIEIRRKPDPIDLYAHIDFMNRHFPQLVWLGGRWDWHQNLILDTAGGTYTFTRVQAEIITADGQVRPIPEDLFLVETLNPQLGNYLVKVNSIYSRGKELIYSTPGRRFINYAEFLDEIFVMKWEKENWNIGIEGGEITLI